MSHVTDSVPRRDGLLTNSPLIPRSDRDGMIAGLETIYRVRRADIGPSETGVAGEANRIALGGVVLHYCRYEAAANVTFGDMPGYRQFFPISGSGRLTVGGACVDLAPGTSGIVRPGSTFNAEYGPGYAHLVVQIDEAVLRDKAPLVIGEDWDSFQPASEATLDGQGTWRVRQVAMTLASQFAAGRPHSPLLVSELEQALISTFLFDHTHVEPARVTTRRTSCETMRRLETYIDANWQKDLSVEDLAQACGLSVRSVFSYFRQQRSATPSAYLRDVRLARAKAMLEANVSGSVMEIALSCGFVNFGHFAQRYRARYGELPSHTLRRAKSEMARDPSSAD